MLPILKHCKQQDEKLNKYHLKSKNSNDDDDDEDDNSNDRDSSVSTNTHSTATISNHQQQQQSQKSYLKWSTNLDYLLFDELGRKLFLEYLKETQNDYLLMLYMIFQCLSQCDKDEQIKKMLKSTYNLYFKLNQNTETSLKQKLIKLIHNEQLINDLYKALESKQYDEKLFQSIIHELKECLEKTFYIKFLKSQFYLNCMKFIEKNEVYLFGGNHHQQSQEQLTLDEQFKFIIDSIKHHQDAGTTSITTNNCDKSDKHHSNAFIIPNVPFQQHDKPKSKSKSKLNDSITSKK